MTFQRARSIEQKEQRITGIVKATARLYKQYRFDEITMAQIAEEAEFTRSNLYKYFSSKEEIFLQFLKHDIILWRKDLQRACRRRKFKSVPTFAAMWVDMLSRHQRFLDLLSIMNAYLETNVPEKSLVSFKREIVGEMTKLTELLVNIFPKLTPEKAGEFIELELASAIGLYQLTNLSEMQRKILEYPEFQHMKIDFKKYLHKSVVCFLHELCK